MRLAVEQIEVVQQQRVGLQQRVGEGAVRREVLRANQSVSRVAAALVSEGRRPRATRNVALGGRSTTPCATPASRGSVCATGRKGTRPDQRQGFRGNASMSRKSAAAPRPSSPTKLDPGTIWKCRCGCDAPAVASSCAAEASPPAWKSLRYSRRRADSMKVLHAATEARTGAARRGRRGPGAAPGARPPP